MIVTDLPRTSAPAAPESDPGVWDDPMPEAKPARPRWSRRLTKPEARALAEIGAYVRWEREYRRGW